MADIVQIGRTHYMDATPVLLGDVLFGYATQIKFARLAIEKSLPHLKQLPLGGTAVGTGLNTPKGYAGLVAAKIAELDQFLEGVVPPGKE